MRYIENVALVVAITSFLASFFVIGQPEWFGYMIIGWLAMLCVILEKKEK